MASSREARLAVQVLSPRQDGEVLRLLSFPGPLLVTAARWSVEIWRGGEVERLRAHGPDELVAPIVARGCNEVRIVRSPGVSQRLVISPTSTLWARVGEARARTRRAESIRALHHSWQRMVRWNEIARCPSLLETFVSWDETADLRSFCRLLRDSLPEPLRDEPLTGGMERLPNVGFVPNILEALAPWPRAMPMLSERFDDLHPVLIGPIDRCLAVADALAAGDVFACGDLPSSVALLHLGEPLASDPAAKQKARPWLVPRDESTRARDLDETAGEVRIAGHLFLTAARRRELSQQGLLPQPPAGWVDWSIVEPEYLDLVGVAAEQMLTALSPQETVLRAREEIRRKYRDSPHGESAADRVWLAHRDVFRSRGRELFGRAADELLELIGQRYFSAPRSS